MTAKKTTAKKTATNAKVTKKADKPKKLSALDAAAKVLAESKEPLNTRQMIEVMAKKGLWTSPAVCHDILDLCARVLATLAEPSRRLRSASLLGRRGWS